MVASCMQNSAEGAVSWATGGSTSSRWQFASGSPALSVQLQAPRPPWPRELNVVHRSHVHIRVQPMGCGAVPTPPSEAMQAQGCAQFLDAAPWPGPTPTTKPGDSGSTDTSAGLGSCSLGSTALVRCALKKLTKKKVIKEAVCASRTAAGGGRPSWSPSSSNPTPPEAMEIVLPRYIVVIKKSRAPAQRHAA